MQGSYFIALALIAAASFSLPAFATEPDASTITQDQISTD